MKKGVVFPEPDCHHLSPSVDRKSPFTGRMRFHQSWYRRTVLGLDPGPNPHARSALYGNMLKAEDGWRGSNFLTDEIFRRAQERFPQAPNLRKPNRLYHNLLGSQTMCINLLGPLKSGKNATRLMRLLPGFPNDATVTGVLFEHAPPKEHHLNDLTSFDAFVPYERSDGRKGFIGVETKLTEPFSKKRYEFDDRYAQWMNQEDWWWKHGAERDFPNTSFNQLWRNHLLVYAMLNQKAPEYSEGYCVVIHPLGDSDCGKALEQYRNLLSPSGKKTLLVWSLETIAERWAGTLERDKYQSQWFDSFRTRYLRFERSEEAWQEFQGTHHE